MRQSVPSQEQVTSRSIEDASSRTLGPLWKFPSLPEPEGVDSTLQKKLLAQLLSKVGSKSFRGKAGSQRKNGKKARKSAGREDVHSAKNSGLGLPHEAAILEESLSTRFNCCRKLRESAEARVYGLDTPTAAQDSLRIGDICTSHMPFGHSCNVQSSLGDALLAFARLKSMPVAIWPGGKLSFKTASTPSKIFSWKFPNETGDNLEDDDSSPIRLHFDCHGDLVAYLCSWALCEREKCLRQACLAHFNRLGEDDELLLSARLRLCARALAEASLQCSGALGDEQILRQSLTTIFSVQKLHYISRACLLESQLIVLRRHVAHGNCEDEGFVLYARLNPCLALFPNLIESLLEQRMIIWATAMSCEVAGLLSMLPDQADPASGVDSANKYYTHADLLNGLESVWSNINTRNRKDDTLKSPRIGFHSDYSVKVCSSMPNSEFQSRIEYNSDQEITSEWADKAVIHCRKAVSVVQDWLEAIALKLNTPVPSASTLEAGFEPLGFPEVPALFGDWKVMGTLDYSSKSPSNSQLDGQQNSSVCVLQ